jgi:hypothetical protein
MKKTKNIARLNYYKAEIKINTTALIELLEQEALLKNEEIVKVFEVYGTTFIALSNTDIMKETESLYPNVFKKCEMPVFQGSVIFSNS